MKNFLIENRSLVVIGVIILFIFAVAKNRDAQDQTFYIDGYDEGYKESHRDICDELYYGMDDSDITEDFYNYVC